MKRILPVIVISQFFCTSLWFAGNAIIADIARQLHLPPAFLAHLTSAVQLGFIAGTLVFAVLSITQNVRLTRYTSYGEYPDGLYSVCVVATHYVALLCAWDARRVALSL